MNPIQDKQDLLLVSLKQFYRSDAHKEMIVSIIKQQTTISLRLLDWLVTNYAKHYNIHFPCNNKRRTFSIWIDYKNQLKAYSKKQFDPFCRRNRIFYFTESDHTVPITKDEIEPYNQRNDGFVTTVGQLNFFRWAISNHVIDYAFNHLSEIESDMLSNADTRKNIKDFVNLYNKQKRSRKFSRTKQSLYTHNIQIVIDFT